MLRPFRRTLYISILAPARGATTHLGKAHQGVTISILAPARGATHRHVGARPAGDISILAPARGATPPVFRFRESLDGFQFSPLREGRPRSGSSPQRRPYFNSRPCERGDASQAPRFHQAAISILAPARGATDSTAIRWYIQAFQFSPLREGRLHPSTYKIAKSHFNSRPCERGDHLLTEYNADTGLFQFSPLREGRPTQYVLRSASQFISILAPARGATIPPEDLVFGTVISILAPARGATQHARTTPPAKLFQFSPLREGRRCTRSNRYHRDTYFNSRPCERGDCVDTYRCLLLLYFNSRPCERGDSDYKPDHSSVSYFNSRPCERGDFHLLQCRGLMPLFQFSPLREGRLRVKFRTALALVISILAPARGATLPGQRSRQTR